MTNYRYPHTYSWWEASILVYNIAAGVWPDFGSEEGDITVIRRPRSQRQIGLKQRSRRLWIPLDGLSDLEMARLADPLMADYDDPRSAIYKHRRYQVPLDLLGEIDPSLDLARVRDIDDVYQPYFLVDLDGGWLLQNSVPFDVEDLVWDRLTTSYL